MWPTAHIEREQVIRCPSVPKSWKQLIEWVDGSMDWVRLAEMKEAYPVQVAAFNWWVHKVIKIKERLIKKVKSKYWRITHKFGIETPKSVEEAYEIDRLTGTSHWTRAIEKE